MKHPIFEHFRSYLLNTPMGVVIGFVLACSLGWVFDADFSEGFEKFYTYLVTVVLSLLVAAFGLAGVFSNIASQEARDEETRKRRLLAARAKLPLALSEMHEVCMFGVRFSYELEALIAQHGNDVVRKQSLEKMTLSGDVLRTFQEIIENHSDEDVADRVMGVLRDYQVFIARWGGEFDPRKATFEVDDEQIRRRTVWWAYLGCLCETIFEYAREEQNLTDVTGNDIWGFLRRGLSWGIGHDVSGYSNAVGLYERSFQREYMQHGE